MLPKPTDLRNQGVDMQKIVWMVVVLVCLGTAGTANAQQRNIFTPENFSAWASQARTQVKPWQDVIKTCEIGTSFSVNKNRQLAPGEEVIKLTVPPEGWIVTTTQRETPRSTTLELKRCKLAPGKEYEFVVGGILPWFKLCGQDFVPEGWKIEGMERTGPQGPQGPQGFRGEKGEKGDKGDPGRDGCNAGMHHEFNNETREFECVPDPKKRGWLTKKKGLIIGGLALAAAGGYTAWYLYCPPGTTRSR